jgi:hypothetical protein
MISLLKIAISSLCLMFVMVESGYAQTGYVYNYTYAAPPVLAQPAPYLEIMVHQTQYYTVMVPVVVNTPIVSERKVIWGNPYVPMTVPVEQYPYWGYDRRCVPKLFRY